MAWLREPVATVTVERDTTGTVRLLLDKLGDLGVPSEVLSDPPRVVGKCLTLAANWVLWQCWADRLEFELETVDAAHTRVRVWAIPNLLLTRPDRQHVRVDVGEVLSALQAG